MTMSSIRNCILILILVQSCSSHNIYNQYDGSDDEDFPSIDWRRRSIEHYVTSNQQLPNMIIDDMKPIHSKRSMSTSSNSLAYMISPISEQLIPLGSYPGQDSRRNGRLILAPSDHYVSNQAPISSSTSKIGVFNSTIINDSFNECRGIRSSIQLERELRDPNSGRILHTCRGLAALNRCDGFCASAVRPSAKSPGGLSKECYCCSEMLLKPRLIRLQECYSNVGSDTGFSNLIPGVFMEITIDEPIECQCRECNSISDFKGTKLTV